MIELIKLPFTNGSNIWFSFDRDYDISRDKRNRKRERGREEERLWSLFSFSVLDLDPNVSTGPGHEITSIEHAYAPLSLTSVHVGKTPRGQGSAAGQATGQRLATFDLATASTLT